MERNKTIMKLCYLQTALYIVFLISLIAHHKYSRNGKIFALLVILSLVGCAVSLTLADYLRTMIQNSGFDVAGVHDKKSLEKKLLQLQNADDTLDVGIMMFDLNNLKKSTTPMGTNREMCLSRPLLLILPAFSLRIVFSPDSVEMSL